jgi:hypothetical protein
MNNMKKIILFQCVLLALAFISCTDKNNDELSAMRINLPGDEFTVSEDITAEFIIGNVDSLYLPHCNFVVSGVIQRKVNGEWENYLSKACLAIYLSGWMMATPNQSIYDSFRIYEEGTYRMTLDYRIGLNTTESEVAASHNFKISN